jgi:eukaryotic-like serine/threonine-protein kinase
MSAGVERETVAGLRLGSVFDGRYEIIRLIGTGGMGSVFEARHTRLGKRVAIKTLHTSFAEKSAGRERFLREAELIAKIRHPNVVDISDVGVHEDVPYLVMEFLEGESLGEHLVDGHPMPSGDVADVMLGVVSGLLAVHRRGVVHRDVKPDNIFLARDPEGTVVPKIIDFGVSKDLGQAASVTQDGQVHTVVGTPHYMSPEQLRGSKQLGPRTDQYAVGVVLYQALTGALPFDGSSLVGLVRSIDEGTFPAPSSKNASLDPAFEEVVVKAMAMNPEGRFESMRELGLALLPFASPEVASRYARRFSGEAPPTFSSGDAVADVSLAGTWVGPESRGASRASSPRPLTSSGSRPIPVDRAAATLDDIPALPGRTRRPLFLGALAAALLSIAAGLGYVLVSSEADPQPEAVAEPAPIELPAPEPAVERFDVRIIPQPANASIQIDQELATPGAYSGSFPIDGTAHVITVSAEGYQTQTFTFRDAPPPFEHVILEPLPKEETVEPPPEPVPSTMRARARPRASAPSRPPGDDLRLSR